MVLDLLGAPPAGGLNDEEWVLLWVDLHLLIEKVAPDYVENIHVLLEEKDN